MKMLRRFAALVMLAATAVFAAQAADVSNLYIHTKKGETITLRFADRPSISFNKANALIIKSATTLTMVKGFALIHKITFDKPSGIEDAVAETKGEIRGGYKTVSLTGFKPGTQVAVYSVGGRVLRSFAIDETGAADVSLEAFESGVYIISAGENVFKMAI